MPLRAALIVGLVCGLAGPASAATLRVGPTRDLTSPSAAAAVARDGDTILIDAATYAGDVAVWTQNRLTLRGEGGRARLEAVGQSAQGKAIWVIAGDRTTVERIAFAGSRVPDRNGAGIRQEGAGLVVRDCLFEDNENAILSGENRRSDILIDRSELRGNGAGDGQSHNLYIGTVRSLTLRRSVIVGARGGHEVKSRALRNDIRFNRIDDASSDASYSVDLPNGGATTLVGNLIVQGPNSPNTAVVSYGAEGLTNPGRRLTLVHNTFVNRIPGRGVFVQLTDGATGVLTNNVFAGDGPIVTGAATRRANARMRVGEEFPRAGSPLVGRAVAVPKALAPGFQPPTENAPAGARPKSGRREIGAFELT